MSKKIAIIPGDGVGTEVMKQSVKVLQSISKRYNIKFEYRELLLGGIAIDKTGHPLPEETIKMCKNSDAVLLGTVGGPKWDMQPSKLRPESGLLGLRKELEVYANLRPIRLLPELKSVSCLKENILAKGIDLMIVRELTGGAYFSEKKREYTQKGHKAWDIIAYYDYEIKRILEKAYEIAKSRRSRLTMIDKANVLESSKLWREITKEISQEYPEVQTDYMYVDSGAMQLIRAPQQFDVIVTENMFGDILSDEASMLTGSLGMLPSASIGETGPGIYEPVHGSAPDIAGQDKVNPIGTVLSIAMMFRYSLDMEKAAGDIEEGVSKALADGYRTFDIMEESMILTGTEEMGDIIAEKILNL